MSAREPPASSRLLTLSLQVHGEKLYELLSLGRDCGRRAAVVLLLGSWPAKPAHDTHVDVPVELFGEDLKPVEQRAGVRGLRAILVNHGRDRVSPFVVGQLQAQVRERDAHLSQDHAGSRGKGPEGAQERVSQGQSLVRGDLIEVPDDLCARRRAERVTLALLGREKERESTRRRTHLVAKGLGGKEFGLLRC